MDIIERLRHDISNNLTMSMTMWFPVVFDENPDEFEIIRSRSGIVNTYAKAVFFVNALSEMNQYILKHVPFWKRWHVKRKLDKKAKEMINDFEHVQTMGMNKFSMCMNCHNKIWKHKNYRQAETWEDIGGLMNIFKEKCDKYKPFPKFRENFDLSH